MIVRMLGSVSVVFGSGAGAASAPPLELQNHAVSGFS
jgi:hypothetical protein